MEEVSVKTNTNTFELKWYLTLNDTWITLLIDPLDCAILILSKPTNLFHLCHQHWICDLVIDVGDEDLTIVSSLDANFRNVTVI